MIPQLPAVLAVLALMFFPSVSSAQHDWGATAHAGLSLWSDTGLLDLDDASHAATPAFGVAIERALTGVFTLEGDVQVLPRFLQRGDGDSLLIRSRLLIASASVAGRFRAGKRVVPRASIGIASVRFSARDRLSVLDRDASFIGIVTSGGAVVRMRRNLAARFDLRYLRTQRDSTSGVFTDGFVDLVQTTAGINVVW